MVAGITKQRWDVQTSVVDLPASTCVYPPTECPEAAWTLSLDSTPSGNTLSIFRAAGSFEPLDQEGHLDSIDKCS